MKSKAMGNQTFKHCLSMNKLKRTLQRPELWKQHRNSATAFSCEMEK